MRNLFMFLAIATLALFCASLNSPASAEGLQIDADQDGIVSVAEFQAAFPDYASNPDVNADGVISHEEMHAARVEMGDTGKVRNRKANTERFGNGGTGENGHGGGGQGGHGGGNGHGGGGQGGHGGGNGNGGRG